MNAERVRVTLASLLSVGCAVSLIYCSSFSSPDSDMPLPSEAEADASPANDGAVEERGAVTGTAAPLLAVEVSSGGSHTCAVDTAHQVFCWGSNSDGQLGVPTAKIQRTSTPVKVDIGGSAVAIASGMRHTCAIMSDATIKCWGANDRGQLGRGNFDPQSSTAVVAAPSANLSAWTAPELLTAGSDFTCVANHETPGPVPVRNVFCWGENATGELGSPKSNYAPSALPVMITFNGDDSDQSLTASVVSAGGSFGCAAYLLPAGAAYFNAIGCWGNRTHGEIGAPAVPGAELVPGRYPSTLADGGVSSLYGPFTSAKVAAGEGHGCATITLNGEPSPSLFCWGNNTAGQTGSTTVGPHPAELVTGFDATNFDALAAGGSNTCFIQNHQVECIGANQLGQLGRGTTSDAATPIFATVDLPPTASVISVGANHSCAVLGTTLSQPGEIACWGDNSSGQLGDGLNLEVGYSDAPTDLSHVRSTPVRVIAPTP